MKTTIIRDSQIRILRNKENEGIVGGLEEKMMKF